MASPSAAQNLVANPGFDNLDGWEVWAQRDEIRPEVSIAETGGREGAAAVITCEAHRDSGQIQQTFGPVTSGATYGVAVWLRPENVPAVSESTWVKLQWMDADDHALEKQFVPLAGRNGDWVRAAARLEAPEGAATAKLEIGMSWAAGGKLFIDEAVVTEIAPVKHLTVRLGTVCYIPSETDGPDDNRRQYAEQADIAGQRGSDIVCLPEGITVVSTGKTYVEVAEPVPGPSTEVLGEVARKHEMYIVAGVYEREGQTVYNT
ncbi:MAG TPA: nitrilase-related carbon-nitrogen hydrolase, partial [Armatimonadota bacterium]|nr:nitrilase-related carbon-nitrogen hydrolase [Armatimonadota bacterium]